MHLFEIFLTLVILSRGVQKKSGPSELPGTARNPTGTGHPVDLSILENIYVYIHQGFTGRCDLGTRF